MEERTVENVAYESAVANGLISPPAPTIVIDEVEPPPEVRAASEEFWESFNSLSPRGKELATLVWRHLYRPAPLLWEGDQA